MYPGHSRRVHDKHYRIQMGEFGLSKFLTTRNNANESISKLYFPIQTSQSPSITQFNEFENSREDDNLINPSNFSYSNFHSILDELFLKAI